MTDSNATLFRNILVDLPDSPTSKVLYKLITNLAGTGTEVFPASTYTQNLDANGLGTQVLPVPSEGAWLWEVALPDGNVYEATLAAGADIQLKAWLDSALSVETASSLVDSFVLKDGDTMTGQLNFSGTDHAGIKLLSLTTSERDALTPAEGMAIYNETDSVVQVYQGAAWVDYGTGGGSAWGGITGTLADQEDLQTELDAKEAAGAAASAVTAHDDTSAHGIADTSLLLAAGDIGVTVQAHSAKTAAIAALTWAANSIILLTGTGTAAVQTLAAHVITLLQSATAADARAAIGAADTAVHFVVAASDETSDLEIATPAVTLRMPHAMTLTEVRANVGTAPTGSALQVDINKVGGASILSTKITIDAGGTTSEAATTPPVISDGTLADDVALSIDIDAVGSSVAGAGLKITFIGTRP